MSRIYNTAEKWSTYLRIDFDVLFMETELLHIFDSSIVFTKVLWLLLLQFVFGRSEVLLRLLHVVVCAPSNSQTWFNVLMGKDENGNRTNNKNNSSGNKRNTWSLSESKDMGGEVKTDKKKNYTFHKGRKLNVAAFAADFYQPKTTQFALTCYNKITKSIRWKPVRLETNQQYTF